MSSRIDLFGSSNCRALASFVPDANSGSMVHKPPDTWVSGITRAFHVDWRLTGCRDSVWEALQVLRGIYMKGAWKEAVRLSPGGGRRERPGTTAASAPIAEYAFAESFARFFTGP
jgi:hypothetical protein